MKNQKNDFLTWGPGRERIAASEMTAFQNFVSKKKDLSFSTYSDFHQYSILRPDQFWNDLIDYYDLQFTGELFPAYEDLHFNQYTWFKNVKLNFAENLLRKGQDRDVALNFIHESGLKKEITYQNLKEQVAAFSQTLKKYLKKKDVLGCYMPNCPETVVSMLSATSLGAIFTSTSCDFGVDGVLDRFLQSRPKVLVAAIGYEYNGKYFDQTEKLIEIEKGLDFLEKLVIVDFLGKGIDLSLFKNAISFQDCLQKTEVSLSFEKCRFDDPLYIMYSSGTTGTPKCIVHSIGGTLLQHIKELGPHTNLTREKNIFYFTTCGWMMWNWLLSSLYFGAKVTLYEGSPAYPSIGEFFNIIEREKINIFGTSPKFLKALEDSGYDDLNRFKSLEVLLSTGAPLLPEQFDFVYQKINNKIQLSSICGGTDIMGCFMLGNPNLPVKRGEIQSLGLAMDVASYDENGKPLFEEEGELVCQKSFPSRPLYFLNDKGQTKIKEAYFNKYENIWHHGDFVTITKERSVKVLGRSDATLNPGGVRIGTAEIYRQTEKISYLEDSLCVGKNHEVDVDIILFVKMKNGETLSDEKIKDIKKCIKTHTTPRHIPRHIFQVRDIPYTRSGKKMEVPVSRILSGKKVTNKDAVSNIECLNEYYYFSKEIK